MKISDDKVKSSCKLGQGESCCAFLLVGGNWWECSKSTPALAFNIRGRLAKGTMNAKGEGDWDTCLFSITN